MDSTTILPTSEAKKQNIYVSLSRYNDLLFIERNISTIIDYKVQQILAAEAAVKKTLL